MSNFKAIATVTAVIRQILGEVQADMTDISTISVKSVPPDSIKTVSEDILNVFLYQVTPNATHRNVDLPTRSRDGTLITKPQLALDLHYLVTAYATGSDELKAQMMLASAMTTLHDNSLITKEKIVAAVQSKSKENEIIGGSNLADQIEAIKISPQTLSIEEISKLWSSFFQTSYRLSVAYQATVVLLESKQTPKPTLPVSKRQLQVFSLTQATINSITPQTAEYGKDTQIEIVGKGLGGDKVLVRFDQLEPNEPNAGNVSDNKISIAIPAGLPAGVKSVQVIRLFKFGENDSGHKGYQSNMETFVLAPKITATNPPSAKPGENLTISFEPGLVFGQKVTVLIGGHVVLPQLPTDPKVYPLKQLTVKITENLPAGTYAVLLRIDKAESLSKPGDTQVIQINSQ